MIEQIEGKEPEEAREIIRTFLKNRSIVQVDIPISSILRFVSRKESS